MDNVELARLRSDSRKIQGEVAVATAGVRERPLAIETRPCSRCQPGERSMPRSTFAIQFEQAFDIHRAINVVATRAAKGTGPTDPAEVVRHLMAEIPDLAMTPAELRETVVQAAADAGLSCWMRC